jgi:hypothetical protein
LEEFRRPKRRFLPQSAMPSSEMDEEVEPRDVVDERALDRVESTEVRSAAGTLMLARRMASRFLAAWRLPAPPRPAAV